MEFCHPSPYIRAIPTSLFLSPLQPAKKKNKTPSSMPRSEPRALRHIQERDVSHLFFDILLHLLRIQNPCTHLNSNKLPAHIGLDPSTSQSPCAHPSVSPPPSPLSQSRPQAHSSHPAPATSVHRDRTPLRP